jgi:hypothetical protein
VASDDGGAGSRTKNFSGVGQMSTRVNDEVGLAAVIAT